MATLTEPDRAVVGAIRTVLPSWATKAQLETLVARFFDRYSWGWLVAGGGCGAANSRQGAERAARRCIARERRRRCLRPDEGPPPLTAVVDLEAAVDQHA